MIFVFGSDPNPILGLGFQAFLFSGYLLFIYSYDSGITSAFVPSLELVPLLFMLIAYPISAFPRLFTVAFCAQNWRDHLNMSWAAIENDPGKFIFWCQHMAHLNSWGSTMSLIDHGSDFRPVCLSQCFISVLAKYSSTCQLLLALVRLENCMPHLLQP